MSNQLTHGGSTLKVAVLQTELTWQDAAANRAHFEKLFPQLLGQDLVVLPETWTSGFSMSGAEIAESMDGMTVQWLLQQAKHFQFAICGSLVIADAGRLFNRMLFVEPDGSIQYYDKKHLFRMAGEHQHYQAGDRRCVVNYRGFRLNLQICYDLRFPVFARNQADYDALIYVANWPAARRHAWRTLLAARAIENQAFVIGCNRVGIDGNGVHYSGDSLILAATGLPLAEPQHADEQILKAELNLADLLQFRQQFPVAMDADPFQLL